MRFQPDSLYYGDCLDVMREWPAGCVDLCYLDPPFNSKANYNILFGRDKGQADLAGDSFAQFVAFEDTWHWDDAAQDRVDAIEMAIGHEAHDVIRGLRIVLGECGMLAYLSYMAERLIEIRRVLKPEGSVYLHCDPTASHYLKAVMDAVFGERNFRNEVVWCYKENEAATRHFPRKHDVLLYYTKSDNRTFNVVRSSQPTEAQLKRYNHIIDGERYANMKGKMRKLEGGAKVRDWWPLPIAQKSERLGYPTQKPVALLERIIKASSDRGDIVLDPFCGCGTTVEAARNLNRRFVGIDISHFAIDLVRDRRLADRSIPVNGVPVDMRTAELMARENPFDFEKWAVTRVPGMVPNAKQVGDSGIDGRGKLLDGGLVLAQVKGGKFALGQLRDFLHVVGRESAECGIFTTLHPVRSPNAKREASAAGYLELGVNRYPKAQFWSIEDYFQNRHPTLPPLADPYTGKPMQMDILASV
ncbi:MAG: site-specific DNA-methyltransferase [Gammaproteobacteria bacterium]|nr:site-specific DNA-methyltransferase [Gammaproteobacteria bacterium]MYK84523.1 site-specific DNA-methyltransferase [Gammaproteobacteria bacterium]